MASKIFSTGKVKHLVTAPKANATNEAGGLAYDPGPKHVLAQLIHTTVFGDAFYAKAEDQFKAFQEAATGVDDEFLAKCALSGRESGFMKDAPAAALMILKRRNHDLFHKIFDRVVDSGRVCLTAAQMVMSGQFGFKCMSYALKTEFSDLLNRRPVNFMLSMVGNDPSIRDVLRVVRPKPVDNERRALFGWLVDAPLAKWTTATPADLPQQVKDLEQFRTSTSVDEQVTLVMRNRFRFDLLADKVVGEEWTDNGAAGKTIKTISPVWKAIALTMGFQALRMNLNTLMRHGVMDDPQVIDYAISKLTDPKEVKRSRQWPYQLFASYRHAEAALPNSVRQALAVAAELACGNIPQLKLPIVIGTDVSGSMSSPVTGDRSSGRGGRGGTTAMKCVDVAAVFSAAAFRRNPDSLLVPFDDSVHEARFDPADSMLSIADRLSRYGGGGTAISLAIHHPMRKHPNKVYGGVVIFTDCQSWAETGYSSYGIGDVAGAWAEFQKNQQRLGNHNSKLICVNLQAYGTIQHPDREDVLNVGGFSDAVYNLIAAYLDDDGGRFVRSVEEVSLDQPDKTDKDEGTSEPVKP